MISRFCYLLVAAALLFSSCSPDLPDDVAEAYAALPAEVDYNLHVKPVLSDKCFACHGPDKAKQKAGLRLDIAENAYAALLEHPDKVAIDPGNPGKSEVFHRILSTDPEFVMPQPESHLTLSSREKAILVKWIEEGAVYKPHWSLVKPVIPEVPEIRMAEFAVNPIDNFVFNKLDEAGLTPSPEASKELLLRRVTLDLTGLPPSLDEIDAFVKDTSPDAYEKQVDRLLNSPHYGEKMAVDWLDAARFADSHGYTVDRIRDMSPYRDWVIKSFNRNLPYDTFIHWQLAGDLMPNPTKEMIVATAFNRNHQQNMEGGIVETEFQAEYVIDRTNTLGDAFLGISLSCARCHDHKYDPISQKEYYELFSFFNNVKEAGQISWNDALPTPTMMLPSAEQEQTIQRIKTMLNEQEQKVRREKEFATADFEKWLQSSAYAGLANAKLPTPGLVARYNFDDGKLHNLADPRQGAEMRRLNGREDPVFEERNRGKALVLNGDVWMDMKKTGIFRRSQPFTIGISVKIPKDLKEGVIFHKSIAERLYNFRGYHLYLKDDRLELNMAHTAPSNAITLMSREPIPRDKWIHLTVTYDGSSKAQGFKLYMDGAPMDTEILMDQLTKDILFRTSSEPGLQVGAWDRGYGFKNGRVDDVAVYSRVLTPFEVKVLAGTAAWSDVITNRAKPTDDSRQVLMQYYLSAIHPGVKALAAEQEKIRTMLADSMESIPELMVMQEMPHPKETYILERGSYDAPGERVFPNTPTSVLPFPDDLPENRWGLAQWLTHEDHPLTSRVAVNRFWQNFFGTGIVKTSDDFGSQGEMPSHPELLDWLAITFRESGWDVKALNKLIVMSATYRQDSRATPALREKDPDNRLLARGPSGRMSAEMIRDNALAASGLMNKKIGGKSVKPYQPDGLWQINNTQYVADTGAAVYRRSLYVLIKRSVPNPTLATFDATSRSYCVVRRQKTNTPLQALVTLNDPTFVEAARVLGEQMARVADQRKGISETYLKLTGRTPSAEEVALLMELQQRQVERFKKEPGKADGWLHSGQHRVGKQSDSLLIAANAVVASTILNSDAALTKR